MKERTKLEFQAAYLAARTLGIEPALAAVVTTIHESHQNPVSMEVMAEIMVGFDVGAEAALKYPDLIRRVRSNIDGQLHQEAHDAGETVASVNPIIEMLRFLLSLEFAPDIAAEAEQKS